MGNKKGHNKRAKVGDFAMTLIMKFFVFVVNFQHQHRSATLWTFQRIISKRKKNGMSPIKKRTKISFLFSRDTFMQFPFLPVMLGIDAIVA